MGKILGWLTIAGLALIVLGIVARVMEAAYPLPIGLLGVGAVCSLLAGILWAHTPGKRRLKTTFLGIAGFVSGGALGLLLGEAVGPSGDQNLGIGILLVIVGGWGCALLFGALGLWWGRTIHRRSGPEGSADPKARIGDRETE